MFCFAVIKHRANQSQAAAQLLQPGQATSQIIASQTAPMMQNPPNPQQSYPQAGAYPTSTPYQNYQQPYQQQATPQIPQQQISQSNTQQMPQAQQQMPQAPQQMTQTTQQVI